MDLAVALDDSLPSPLHRQLYNGLREAILSGRLAGGHRVPSTRALARQLTVSRNTVSQAYQDLEAEGYLAGRHGSGTYVSRELPEEPPHGGFRGQPPEQSPAIGGAQSRRGARRLGATEGIDGQGESRGRLPYDFHPGHGAWDVFPREVWRRLLTRQWRSRWHEAMDYGDPGGYRPLREEIARYLARSRAVRCTPEEVVIVNGIQQALDLLARILLAPGDVVGIEDPGYPAARQVFASYGARLVPVAVDRDGMAVDRARGQGIRLVLVTPSHQFPTGATMSLSRRLSLLGWARAEGGLVVEDDYDSEFRFEGRPLASLQGLDDSGSVVYLGSFSKVLFPSLRVGYAVLPPDLVMPFEEAKDLTDRQTPILEQQVLAGFLGEGHFERHLRRMRQLYRARRQALVEALGERMPHALKIIGASAGMHLMARIVLPLSEEEVVSRSARVGVGVYPARPYYRAPSPGPALVLGYAGLPEERIRQGVQLLAKVLLSNP